VHVLATNEAMSGPVGLESRVEYIRLQVAHLHALTDQGVFGQYNLSSYLLILNYPKGNGSARL
jgi:hypothetical protein